MWRVIQSAKILQSTTEPCRNAILAGGRIIPIARSWDDLENKPFGVKTEMVEIVPDTVVEKTRNNGTLYRNTTALVGFTPEENKIYIVKINDAVYKVKCGRSSRELILGNSKKMGYSSPDSTSDPFGIVVYQGVEIGWLSDVLGETITVAIYEEQEVVKPLDPKFVGDVVIETTDEGVSWTCTHTFDELVDMYWNAPAQLAKTIIFYDLYRYGRAYVGRPYRINVNEFADEEGVEYIAFECDESRCNVKITPDGIYSNSEPA